MKKRPSSRNRERIESDDLLRKLMELLYAYRGMIRVTILKNIAFGDLCVGHVVSRGSGRKRLALESCLRPMSAAGDRAERKRTAALSVLG